jgi:hypothetical protein
MIEWTEVVSTRITAMAYDAANEKILVRFPKGGKEWEYRECPPVVWERFSAPTTSKGEFINEILNLHDHGPYLG